MIDTANNITYRDSPKQLSQRLRRGDLAETQIFMQRFWNALCCWLLFPQSLCRKCFSCVAVRSYEG